MPIKFVSMNSAFVNMMKEKGGEAIDDRIENYVLDSNRRTYFVSPANSLCFMDGGIDYSLSRNMMPGVEAMVKERLKSYGKVNKLGRKYLPIGSSFIVDYDSNRSLVVSPTMLLPQDVSKTRNAYYAVMAVLYNVLINYGARLDEVDIVFTSMCCGFGRMDPKESVKQTFDAFQDFRSYQPQVLSNTVIFAEPNLDEQPKTYENMEFKSFPIEELVRY